ncbi:MAG: hypothetical protein IKF17_05490 [Clostridia bacterium]|nr:hypothetical protein [Clostridia bacterium]
MTTIRTRLAQNEKRILKERTIFLARKMLENDIRKEGVQKITGLSTKEIEKILK